MWNKRYSSRSGGKASSSSSASVSVAAPVFRLGRYRLALVVRLVTDAAQRLSAEIGYQGPAIPQQPAARAATARPRARRS